ncbi:LapA family protein [Acidovorax sp. sif1233]|uniref:LapA family protein n=1 Tax=unclassified Acidovorax TaxID=2684926 RepID=UPI001C49375E|nr:MULTISPECIES: LapA family protein [unclassified Acidovorax]MBV7429205.1 LapA family protein [Acidovorax sp. sif0732]MBV7451031.1 LapA family protein [Acidovorax sp. sif0715]MBV7453992.1 LapA family protein [Acidovorax sp. sif1233]
MHLRSIVLLLTVLAIAILAALNWPTLAAPALVSLGIVVFEAPLGLIMLALTALLGIFFLAYVLSLQGSVLMETRRHGKEMQVQRELADKAEASRFTELRTFLDAQHHQAHAALLTRLDQLEARLAARVAESDNSTAAYVGQLEHQLRTRGLEPAPVVPPLV